MGRDWSHHMGRDQSHHLGGDQSHHMGGDQSHHMGRDRSHHMGKGWTFTHGSITPVVTQRCHFVISYRFRIIDCSTGQFTLSFYSDQREWNKTSELSREMFCSTVTSSRCILYYVNHLLQ